jgi:hypothetical protein
MDISLLLCDPRLPSPVLPKKQASPSSVPRGADGGPEFPAISELQPEEHPAKKQRRWDPKHKRLVRPKISRLSPPPQPEESLAKAGSKWSPEEDMRIIELRNQPMEWSHIAKQLPGRSAPSCRMRHQNYLERKVNWDEKKKNELASRYAVYVQKTSCVVILPN